MVRTMAGKARVVGMLACVVALAAGLAGCGESSPADNGLATNTPAQIVAAAMTAAEHAATVHVSGSIVGRETPISLDMELVGHKGGAGHVALAGLSAELVDVDSALYIKGNSALYRRLAGPTAARLLQGRWLKGRASSRALEPLAALTNLQQLVSLALGGHGPLTRAPAARIDGRDAVGVTDLAHGGTLYVAATGAAYPLELIERGARSGKLVFDRWNQAYELEVPTEALSIAQLQSGR